MLLQEFNGNVYNLASASACALFLSSKPIERLKLNPTIERMPLFYIRQFTSAGPFTFSASDHISTFDLHNTVFIIAVLLCPYKPLDFHIAKSKDV
jgi:hypothetical protein